jgi:hypothetical protein
MDNDINDFIKKENVKLYNLQTGLSAQQRARLLPKIRNIRLLLNLLKNENLSKKDTKDLENKIEDTTDKLADKTKKEQLQNLSTLSIVKKIKPNITELDSETKKKALMVKASGDYDTLPDENLTNSFLSDNDIDYSIDPELSTKESLVLINNSDPTDIKVAYRGSKMNNVNDWISNGKILLGKEKSNSTFEDSFNDASNQIESVKTKYGTLPNELLGFSRGGSLAISGGDKFGINTTTFNTFVGRNILKSRETSAKHTLFRTTEDIPSLGLGFKADLNNFNIKVIRPLIDSVNPRQAHGLRNFTERGARANANDPNLLENQLQEVATAAKKHGEAQSLADAASVLENSKPIPVSKDLYNINAKIKNNNSEDPLLGHGVEDDLYVVGEQTTESKVNKMISDENEFSNEIDDFREFVLNHSNNNTKSKNKKNIMDLLKPPEKLTNDMLGDMEREERAAKKKQTRLSRQEELETRTEAPRLDMDRPNVSTSGEFKVRNMNNKTLTDFIESISPADIVIDSNGNKNLSSRIHDKSGFVNMWDDINGNYTPEELDHINSMNVTNLEDYDFSLSESERNKIYNSTPEERHKIVKDYEQKAHDTMKATDEYASIPVEGQAPRTMTGDFVAGLNPINLLVGLGAQKSADSLLNTIDPDMPVVPKSALSGAAGGALGEAAIMGLSGLGAGISATALAPAAAVGAAASLTGLGTEKLLDKTKLKDNQLAKTAIEGSTSGAVAGLGTVVAGSSLLGAEAGIPLDFVTGGAASVVGAGLGTIIGLGSYGLSKLGLHF